MKYADFTLGQVEAVFNKIGGASAVNAFLRGELEVKPVEKPARIEFTVQGTGLTAAAWISTIESAGHKIGDWARDILSKPDYDAKHRLEAGKEYKIVLVRGKEIARDSDRTTKNLKAVAIKEFGKSSVSDLKGELALLTRMKFSNAELEQMGLWYIAVLHEPIIDSGGDPRVLCSHRVDDRSWVFADYGRPDNYWSDFGAFAFLAE